MEPILFGPSLFAMPVYILHIKAINNDALVPGGLHNARDLCGRFVRDECADQV